MIDIGQLGLPAVGTAHGRKWVLTYRVGATKDGSGSAFLACEAEAVLPAPIFLIKVPDNITLSVEDDHGEATP